jgi:hypothetical protein
MDSMKRKHMDEKHGLHEGNKDIDLDGGEIYGLDEGKW